MDLRDKIRNSCGDFKELKEAEELYINCLDDDNVEDFKSVQKHPSLRYTVYTALFLLTFKDRIIKIVNNIEELKKKLNDYQGNKVNKNREIEKLDETVNKLISFKKEAYEGFQYYSDYMAHLAHESDRLNNETAKNLYINASENIIIIQIKNYLKYERNLLIINDNIKQLENVFNN